MLCRGHTVLHISCPHSRQYIGMQMRRLCKHRGFGVDGQAWIKAGMHDTSLCFAHSSGRLWASGSSTSTSRCDQAPGQQCMAKQGTPVLQKVQGWGLQRCDQQLATSPDLPACCSLSQAQMQTCMTHPAVQRVPASPHAIQSLMQHRYRLSICHRSCRDCLLLAAGCTCTGSIRHAAAQTANLPGHWQMWQHTSSRLTQEGAQQQWQQASYTMSAPACKCIAAGKAGQCDVADQADPEAGIKRTSGQHPQRTSLPTSRLQEVPMRLQGGQLCAELDGRVMG